MFGNDLEITRNLNFLFPDHTNIEIRMLNVPNEGTVSGIYSDHSNLVSDIRRYDGKTNIFFTLNKLNDAVASRSYNHLTKYAKVTTKDSEIVRRSYVLIDVDSKRISGVSSTDVEHEKALELADEIKAHLKGESFSCVISCDSGNGGHLLLPVDMDVDRNSNELIRNFLLILDKKFSNDFAEVDVTTYNLARICKLYGTIAVKGDNTSERPHRRSHILENIDDFEVEIVKKEVIETYVNKYGKLLNVRGENHSLIKTIDITKETDDFDLVSWIEQKGFTIRKKKFLEDGGVLYDVEPCMFNSGHDDGPGFFVGKNKKGYFSQCMHSKCKGKNWDTLWQLYNPDKPNPNDQLKTKKGAGKVNVLKILLELIENQGHKFFKNQYNEIYVIVKELNSVWKLNSFEYSGYLLALFLEKTGEIITKDKVKNIIDVLQGRELLNDNFRPTFQRFGSIDENYYYYLNDTKKRMVAIRKNESGLYHYSIEKAGDEVMFVATPIMKEQIAPNKDVPLSKTYIEYMKKYYGILNEPELLLHNVLLCYRYLYGLGQPIAVFMGAKGSGKTTLCSFDARIINPTINSVTSKPISVKDWYVLLNNTDVAILDNVSTISSVESNICCQAVQEFSVSSQRELYSDNKLVIYKLYTSLYFTTIGLVTYQADLLDRAIFFHTKRFNSSERIEETRLRKEFEEDLPQIVTSIFNVIVKALNMMEEDKKNNNVAKDDIYIRITSFQIYGEYLARAMGYSKKDFIDALKNNDKEIKTDLILESDFATLIKKFMSDKHYIKGTATEVLNKLKQYCLENDYYLDEYAKTPAKLGRSLTEYEDILKSVGIVVKKKKSNGVRLIEIAERGNLKFDELIQTSYEINPDDFEKKESEQKVVDTTSNHHLYFPIEKTNDDDIVF